MKTKILSGNTVPASRGYGSEQRPRMGRMWGFMTHACLPRPIVRDVAESAGASLHCRCPCRVAEGGGCGSPSPRLAPTRAPLAPRPRGQCEYLAPSLPVAGTAGAADGPICFERETRRGAARWAGCLKSSRAVSVRLCRPRRGAERPTGTSPVVVERGPAAPRPNGPALVFSHGALRAGCAA